jgi:O-antigen/teichoic acid export membrane protein
VKVIARLQAFKSKQGIIKYLKNTSWLFGEKVLRITVGLFIGIWVARYLGPEQFGLFSYAQSFVGLFSAIATLGLNQIVVRELVRDENRKYELIGTAFWLIVMGAVATLVILAIAVNFTSNDQYTNLLIFIIASSTIFQSFNVIDFYFQSKVISKYVVYANTLSLFISSIAKIVLIINEASLIYFAWVVLFDSFILAMGFIYYFLKKNSKFKVKYMKFRKNTALGLLKDSWPLILSGVAVMVYMRIDQIMLKEMLDNNAVGIYASAIRLSEAWYFIPTVILTSLFPAIIKAKQRSEKLYNDRIQKLYGLLVWMAIIMSIIITFIGKPIILLLFGEPYSEASSVLTIHIWASIFVVAALLRGKWFVAENLTKYSLYTVLVGMTLNIILNYFLIKEYGVNGAAYATLFARVLSLYIIAIFFVEIRKTIKDFHNALIYPFSIIRNLKV